MRTLGRMSFLELTEWSNQLNNRFARDFSQHSIEFLSRRCREYFGLHHPEVKHIWFVDGFEPIKKEIPRDEVLDLVFFGDFVRRFLESGNWLHEHYRFWCLSQSVKQSLEAIFKIPSDRI